METSRHKFQCWKRSMAAWFADILRNFILEDFLLTANKYLYVKGQLIHILKGFFSFFLYDWLLKREEEGKHGKWGMQVYSHRLEQYRKQKHQAC